MRRLLAPSVVLATAALAAATLPSALAVTAPETLRTAVLSGVLTDAVPSWAHGTPDAAMSGSSDVSFVVQMATRDASGLKAFDAAASNPASASYRHFLTPAQYRSRFAPSEAALGAVRSFLAGAGLTVDSVSPQRTFLTVHGTASVVSSVFSTGFGRFQVGGLLLRAPMTAPVLPAALRGLVANVAGLAESAPLHPDASPSPGFANARPCSTYYGQKTAKAQPAYQGVKQAYAICGYTGQQLRSAYGVDQTGLAGKGATVAIVDAYASPTIGRDANTYARRNGDPTFKPGQLTQEVPPGEMQIPEDPASLLLDPQGWAGEETLDVEAVHAIAPAAKVIYQSAVSPYGPMLYVALAQAVEEGKAQIVSNSYGTGGDSPLPTDQLVFDQITDEAAATGVTIDFSSGDSGDETDPSAAGTRTGDFPATSPGVVAVGGTTLEIDKSGHSARETYWGTRKDVLANGAYDFKNVLFSGAGGGGVSTTYAEPSWQKKVVPGSLATFGGVPAGRVEPDVSMDADSTTGFLVGQTQTFAGGKVRYGEYRIGGTSLSCPLFSGVLALAVGQRHGKGLGLVTPTLYAASTKAKQRSKLFNDPSGVKVDPKTHQSTLANVRPDYTDPTDLSSKVLYSLRTLGNLATLHRLAGYDDSTGLGTPKVGPLVKRLVSQK